MVRVKTSFIFLTLMLAAVVLAGCASQDTSPGKPLVVATVGDPTPIPTEPPAPTQGPTWTPTPTPVPDPISMTSFKLDGKINGDQPPMGGDPNDTRLLNARYATRRDTATFTVKNTGGFPLEGLSIVYQLGLMVTTTGDGEYITAPAPIYTTEEIGTLKPGETHDLVIVSPPYEAMQEANVTIIAKWDNGTFQLYSATLEPNLSGGISASDVRAVMTYGSANN